LADHGRVGTIQIDDNLLLFCASNHNCDLLLALGGNSIANTLAAYPPERNLLGEKQGAFDSPCRPILRETTPKKAISAESINRKYAVFVKLLFMTLASLAPRWVVV
jgi:hypothetical protein